ncbi:MAG: peptidylprolyl isomerase [Ruminococcus sp.]|nr:peptidylprolyl isomerase [Ruminococcus sp.]
MSLCFVLSSCGDNSSSQGDITTETNPKVSTEDVANLGNTAIIDVRDYGKITIELKPEIAPITVENFKKLVSEHFYDGLTFHRIMEGFMIQGGDPLGNGTGGSEETIRGEFSINGFENNLSHTRGVISMARSNDPNSASSQFFIVHQDSTFLDGQYAAFGVVTDGMDVVDKIAEDSNPVDNNGTILANEQPVINSITLE